MVQLRGLFRGGGGYLIRCSIDTCFERSLGGTAPLLLGGLTPLRASHSDNNSWQHRRWDDSLLGWK